MREYSRRNPATVVRALIEETDRLADEICSLDFLGYIRVGRMGRSRIYAINVAGTLGERDKSIWLRVDKRDVPREQGTPPAPGVYAKVALDDRAGLEDRIAFAQDAPRIMEKVLAEMARHRRVLEAGERHDEKAVRRGLDQARRARARVDRQSGGTGLDR